MHFVSTHGQLADVLTKKFSSSVSIIAEVII